MPSDGLRRTPPASWTSVALVVGFGVSLSCGLFGDPALADGEFCERDQDCSSELCTENFVCHHTRCRCDGPCPKQGASSSACRSGWACVDDESILGKLAEVFKPSRDGRGYCQPLCENGCPERYKCDWEEGVFCVVDERWMYPEVTLHWSGATEGEMASSRMGGTDRVDVEGGGSLRLRGEASSPVGAAITTWSWSILGEDIEGVQEIDLALEPNSGFNGVSLTVVDAEGRSERVFVIFSVCYEEGEFCGSPSGQCCGTCHEDTQVCQ